MPVKAAFQLCSRMPCVLTSSVCISTGIIRMQSAAERSHVYLAALVGERQMFHNIVCFMNVVSVCSWKEPSAQDIASHKSDSSASLYPDNIIIDVARVSHLCCNLLLHV